MIRPVVFAAALLGLAFTQPPMESALGQYPAPPVVGIAGTSSTGESGGGHMDYFEVLKYGITQGGLTLVLLVVAWSYRRDFLRKADKEKDDKEILITLVEKNTTALTLSESTHARLARAIEDRRLGGL